jgi:hypothetical protein
MRRAWLMPALLLLVPAPLPGAAPPGGPPRIDRTIAKEPAYKSKPSYCLLLLGNEAKTRVWLVLDGNTLYVDRNGNGDLTERGEAVSAPGGGFASFNVEAIADRAGGAKHTNLRVGVMPEDRTRKREGYWHLSIDVHDRYRQYAFMHKLGSSAKDAPVVHFGGPLQMGMSQPEKQPLVRGDKPSQLNVYIATKYPGVEWVAVDHGKGVPKDVHPQAEITFPGKEPGAEPITVKVKLTQRC